MSEPAARPAVWRYFAVAAPGIEPVLAREVAALPGASEVQRVPGGVEFAGPLEVCWRANLELRTATRVLVRVGDFEAHDFSRLRRRAEALPWKLFTDGSAPLALHVSQARCRLYHTGAVGERLNEAVVAALGAKPNAIDPKAPPVGLFARGQNDRWTLSLDASGELLHKRGWRTETALAPLRETLAAALLELCDWDPATPLVDPMCGAGTFAIEACARAMKRAPGLGRAFAFQRWPIFDPESWRRLLDDAERAVLPHPPAPICASDHDPEVMAAARRNAERAGLGAALQLAELELRDVTPPAFSSPGLVIVNPPYGHRVGDRRALGALYSELGRLLRTRFAGWRAGVLVADPRLARALGLRSEHEVALQNGGLRVRLLRYRL
ncbi:MAG TPA: hypothetical protein VII38_14435 [Polyangia bacterium]